MAENSKIEQFVFTSENLLDNLDKLGGWSAYALACEALQHYFPEEYDENGHCEIQREVELTEKLECNTWVDLIKKFHAEVGYKSFNPDVVNEF